MLFAHTFADRSETWKIPHRVGVPSLKDAAQTGYIRPATRMGFCENFPAEARRGEANMVASDSIAALIGRARARAEHRTSSFPRRCLTLAWSVR
jgi:hypothetical protein